MIMKALGKESREWTTLVTDGIVMRVEDESLDLVDEDGDVTEIFMNDYSYIMIEGEGGDTDVEDSG